MLKEYPKHIDPIAWDLFKIQLRENNKNRVMQVSYINFYRNISDNHFQRKCVQYKTYESGDGKGLSDLYLKIFYFSEFIDWSKNITLTPYWNLYLQTTFHIS